MERTISIMLGQGSPEHNCREFVAENVDESRLDEDIHYKHENLKDVYHELFDEALAKYNKKQTRKDRVIGSYYEKIRMSKQEKLFYEIIVQVGNEKDMCEEKERELGGKVLDKYYQGFQERNPNLRVFSAHLHMDEATPHIHIDFVPFTTESKQGLETKVSMKQALAARGFIGKGRSNTEWNQWVSSEKNVLAEVMKEYGIEWKKLGTHDEHLSVLAYKKEERQKEVEILEAKRDAICNEIETVEKVSAIIEKQKEMAVQDPEEYLPEAKGLELAKGYRERIKPTIEKTMSFIGNLFEKCKSLERDCAYYKRSLQTVDKKYEGIRKENDKAFQENKQLRSENSRMKNEIKQLENETVHLKDLIDEIEPDIVNKAIAAIRERVAPPVKKRSHVEIDYER